MYKLRILVLSSTPHLSTTSVRVSAAVLGDQSPQFELPPSASIHYQSIANRGRYFMHAVSGVADRASFEPSMTEPLVTFRVMPLSCRGLLSVWKTVDVMM